jgi:hypothetical protein
MHYSFVWIVLTMHSVNLEVFFELILRNTKEPYCVVQSFDAFEFEL